MTEISETEKLAKTANTLLSIIKWFFIIYMGCVLIMLLLY